MAGYRVLENVDLSAVDALPEFPELATLCVWLAGPMRGAAYLLGRGRGRGRGGD